MLTKPFVEKPFADGINCGKSVPLLIVIFEFAGMDVIHDTWAEYAVAIILLSFIDNVSTGEVDEAVVEDVLGSSCV